MHKAIYQVFFFLHQLSIDVAVGACAMLYAVGQLFKIVIPTHYFFLLAIGTLIIYWVDHVLDSQNPLLVQPNKRHFIFNKYKPIFLVAIISLITINAYYSIVFLSRVELLFGLILLGSLGLYLFYHKKLVRIFILEKELLISSLYVTSILFAPITIINGSILSYSSISLLIVGLNLMLLALQNLFSMSVIESTLDSENAIKNITQIYGPTKIREVQAAMLMLQIVLSIILWILIPTQITFHFCLLILFISTLQYLLPRIFKQPQNNVYRMLADGVFVLVLVV